MVVKVNIVNERTAPFKSKSLIKPKEYIIFKTLSPEMKITPV